MRPLIYFLSAVMILSPVVPASADDLSGMSGVDAVEELTPDSTMEEIGDTDTTSENMSNVSDSPEETDPSEDTDTYMPSLMDYYTVASSFQTLNEMQGNAMSLSSAISKVMGISDMKALNIADVSDLTLPQSFDAGILDQEYALAIQNTKRYTDVPDLVGKSDNAMTIFMGEYGNVIDSVNFKDAEIPSSFSPSAMLSTAASAMASQYKAATSSGEFQAVKNNLGLSGIFSTFSAAQSELAKGSSVSAKDLKSTGYLNSMLSISSSVAKKTIDSDYAGRKSASNAAGNSYKNSMYANVANNFFKVTGLNRDFSNCALKSDGSINTSVARNKTYGSLQTVSNSDQARQRDAAYADALANWNAEKNNAAADNRKKAQKDDAESIAAYPDDTPVSQVMDPAAKVDRQVTDSNGKPYDCYITDQGHFVLKGYNNGKDATYDSATEVYDALGKSVTEPLFDEKTAGK